MPYPGHAAAFDRSDRLLESAKNWAFELLEVLCFEFWAADEGAVIGGTVSLGEDHIGGIVASRRGALRMAWMFAWRGCSCVDGFGWVGLDRYRDVRTRNAGWAGQDTESR